MAAHWSGKVYVLKQADGKFQIGVTLPPGVLDATSVTVYDGQGPGILLGFPATQVVGDVDKWIAEKAAAGFTFFPTTLS